MTRVSELQFYNNKDIIEQIEWLKEHIGGARLQDIRLTQDTTPGSETYGQVTMTFVMEDGAEFNRTFSNVGVNSITSRQEGENLIITFHLANGQTYDVTCHITVTATTQWSALIGDPHDNADLTLWMNEKEGAAHALATYATRTQMTGEVSDRQAADSALSQRINANATAIANIVDTLTNILYPIGSIFMGVTDVNPSTWLTGTSWARYAGGRTIIGVSNEYPNQSEGGVKEVTLSINQMPSHDHDSSPHSHRVGSDASENRTEVSGRHNHNYYNNINQLPYIHPGDYIALNPGDRREMSDGNILYSGDHYHIVDVKSNTVTISPRGGGLPHNNMMPYIATYIWVRTA